MSGARQVKALTLAQLASVARRQESLRRQRFDELYL